MIFCHYLENTCLSAKIKPYYTKPVAIFVWMQLELSPHIAYIGKVLRKSDNTLPTLHPALQSNMESIAIVNNMHHCNTKDLYTQCRYP